MEGSLVDYAKAAVRANHYGLRYRPESPPLHGSRWSWMKTTTVCGTTYSELSYLSSSLIISDYVRVGPARLCGLDDPSSHASSISFHCCLDLPAQRAGTHHPSGDLVDKADQNKQYHYDLFPSYTACCWKERCESRYLSPFAPTGPSFCLRL
jgi:hypothetical protein